MNYILATFASRNETMAYTRLLRNAGLNAQVINTPAALSGGGCSISVVFQSGALAMAQRLLSNAHFMSFRGFFQYGEQNGRQYVEKL